MPVVDYGDENRISTIIEIDYIENKYGYELDNNKKKKEFDTVDNPVVEILFSENDDPTYSYRLGKLRNSVGIPADQLIFLFHFLKLVLGEKLNRLAYVEVVEYRRFIKYNNYSPKLPSWPFAINVTVDKPSYCK